MFDAINNKIQLIKVTAQGAYTADKARSITFNFPVECLILIYSNTGGYYFSGNAIPYERLSTNFITISNFFTIYSYGENSLTLKRSSDSKTITYYTYNYQSSEKNPETYDSIGLHTAYYWLGFGF